MALGAAAIRVVVTGGKSGAESAQRERQSHQQPENELGCPDSRRYKAAADRIGNVLECFRHGTILHDQ